MSLLFKATRPLYASSGMPPAVSMALATHAVRDVLLRQGPLPAKELYAAVNKAHDKTHTVTFLKRKVLWRMKDRSDVTINKLWAIGENGKKMGEMPTFRWTLTPQARHRELQKRRFPRTVSTEKDALPEV